MLGFGSGVVDSLLGVVSRMVEGRGMYKSRIRMVRLRTFRWLIKSKFSKPDIWHKMGFKISNTFTEKFKGMTESGRNKLIEFASSSTLKVSIYESIIAKFCPLKTK